MWNLFLWICVRLIRINSTKSNTEKINSCKIRFLKIFVHSIILMEWNTGCLSNWETQEIPSGRAVSQFYRTVLARQIFFIFRKNFYVIKFTDQWNFFEFGGNFLFLVINYHVIGTFYLKIKIPLNSYLKELKRFSENFI